MMKIKRNHKNIRQTKTLNLVTHCTLQGVPQGRTKLTCDTPFLLVRNLSVFRFYCGITLAICKENLTGMFLSYCSFHFHHQSFLSVTIPEILPLTECLF